MKGMEWIILRFYKKSNFYYIIDFKLKCCIFCALHTLNKELQTNRFCPANLDLFRDQGAEKSYLQQELAHKT